MYECQDCSHRFKIPLRLCERHNLTSPPFENFDVCPACKSTNFKAVKVFHCRCCGARLPQGKSEYCDDVCMQRGKKLWLRENARKNRILTDPLNVIVRQLEEYNRINHTKYSYGQFVGIILPRIAKEK